MNIKMGTLIFAAAAAMLASVASAAEDSYIYWMVEGSNIDGTPLEFDYAKIKVATVDGVEYLNMYHLTGGDAGDRQWSDIDNPTISDGGGPMFAGKFDSSTANSFIVELFNANDEQIAWQTYSSAYVSDYIFSGNQIGGGTGLTYLAVSQVTPEPSSGLLMLLGGALLALRRRKVIA